MRAAVVTLFPEMFATFTDYGVSGRAVKDGVLTLSTWNPRDFTTDKHQTVDARPYGGGPGMVMMIEPLRKAVTAARQWLLSGDKPCAKVRVIYLSPQGKVFSQRAATHLAKLTVEEGLILLAGRYEGVDERLLEMEVDEEYSVGDYVVSGGELPAMLLLDAVARLLPGVLGDERSAVEDSFADDGLLDCPHYTRPEVYEGRRVPDVLLSGNHEAIRQWRLEQSVKRTRLRRPDLLNKEG